MITIFAVLCRWAYVRKYGQLTDITGQPISRASSASSAQAFQQRPRAVDRSLTCDSDLSGSSSGSEGEGEGEDMIPAGQFQDGPASRKKTGGSALGQHSAKPQSACKPCRFQQCCMLFLYILAVTALPALCPVSASLNLHLLLVMNFVFAHVCDAV